jgi:hypothetical protein
LKQKQSNFLHCHLLALLHLLFAKNNDDSAMLSCSFTVSCCNSAAVPPQRLMFDACSWQRGFDACAEEGISNEAVHNIVVHPHVQQA